VSTIGTKNIALWNKQNFVGNKKYIVHLVLKIQWIALSPKYMKWISRGFFPICIINIVYMLNIFHSHNNDELKSGCFVNSCALNLSILICNIIFLFTGESSQHQRSQQLFRWSYCCHKSRSYPWTTACDIWSSITHIVSECWCNLFATSGSCGSFCGQYWQSHFMETSRHNFYTRRTHCHSEGSHHFVTGMAWKSAGISGPIPGRWWRARGKVCNGNTSGQLPDQSQTVSSGRTGSLQWLYRCR
jgi:hypothetical protein